MTPGSPETEHAARFPDRRWMLRVGAIVALGLVVRAAYVIVVLDDVPSGLDALWYQLQGGSIREGYGYTAPRSLFSGEPVPTAAFPPLYPLYQAAWQHLVGPGPESVRLAGLIPAGFTIALTALLGRHFGGRRVGLVAAGIVAVHPGLVAADGSGMSENLTVPLVVGAQLLALRLAASIRWRRRLGLAAALGVVFGLAVLTRQDLVFVAALLGVWLLVSMPAEPRRRVVTVAVAALAATAVVAPWVWRNHRALDVAAVSTLSPTSALAGANCDSTYSGANLGSWDYDCVVAARPSQASEEELAEMGITEAQLVESYQSAASDHVRHHASRLPVVVAAREARAWSLWDPTDLARRDAEETRRYGWQVVARPIEAAFAVVGAVGLVGLARRRDPSTFVLVAPVVAVAVSVAIGYGNPRFNVVAQPSLAVAAAWLALRRRPTAPRRR